MKQTADLSFRWADAQDEVNPLIRLFVESAPAEYISQGELQDGRASAVGVWSNDLEEILKEQFSPACRREGDGTYAETRLALAHGTGSTLLGIAYVAIERAAPNPYAVLYDLVIREEFRGRGTGGTLLNWIETELRAEGVRLLFLESGAHNAQAQRFFQRAGFSAVSINMLKPL